MEDGEHILQAKCEQLADILKRSKKTVIYTGAGISTVSRALFCIGRVEY